MIKLSGVMAIATIIAFAFVVWIGNSFATHSAPTHGSEQPATSPVYAGITPIPDSSPAVKPSSPENNDPSISNGDRPNVLRGASALSRPITAASVRTYIMGRLSSLMPGVEAQDIRIADVTFSKLGEIRPYLNEPALDTLPADEPVVYVSLLGDFTVIDAPPDTPMFHAGYMLFSAATGNELLGGVR